MTAEGFLPGEQGNLDDGKGCYEIFQSTSEFSGVGHGDDVALPETGAGPSECFISSD